MAEGTVAFLCGRWRDSLAHCDVAERVLRDECVGVASELSSANQMSLLRIYAVRVFTAYLRTSAWLGALAGCV
jgi:hypothetical protein